MLFQRLRLFGATTVLLLCLIDSSALAQPSQVKTQNCAHQVQNLSNPVVNCRTVITNPVLFFDELIAMVKHINMQNQYKEEFVKRRSNLPPFDKWLCLKEQQPIG